MRNAAFGITTTIVARLSMRWQMRGVARGAARAPRARSRRAAWCSTSLQTYLPTLRAVPPPHAGPTYLPSVLSSHMDLLTLKKNKTLVTSEGAQASRRACTNWYADSAFWKMRP